MRTLRLSLVGTVILALLGGMGGTVLAQDAEAAPFDEPYQVAGKVFYPRVWRLLEKIWDDERQVEERTHYLENPIEMDDPRLSGLLRRIWNCETYGGPREAGLGEVMAARTELVNDDGTWVGTMRGYVAYGPRRHYWQFELTGTGAYEGHTALLWTQGPGGGPQEVEGFVFPGPLPEYPAELPAE